MSPLRSRTRKSLSDDPAIDIEHFKAEVVILGPGCHLAAVLKDESVRRLPCAVVDADVDVRLPRALARLAGIPSAHVSRRSDRVVAVEDGYEFLDVLLPHCLPDVLDDPRHIERDDQPPAQVVLIEHGGRDGDTVGGDELLDDPHQLRQQDLPAAPPGMLHLVENVPRCLEDDALCAEFPR